MKNKVVRFLIFFLGLSALSLGIALVTRAGQGTSTVSSFAYVMQRLTHFSMGLWVVITNGLFFVAQLFISRERWWQKFAGQMSAAAIFGFTIDIAMGLTANIHPANLLWAVLEAAGGSAVVGFGVSALVFARLIVLPVEGVGHLRTGADVVIVTCAAVASWIAFGDFEGLGLGTVIAALLSGSFSKFFLRGWGRVFPEHRIIP